MGEHFFERLACERNIMVEEMRVIISARIEKGWNNPNMEMRVQQRKIPFSSLIWKKQRLQHLILTSGYFIDGNRKTGCNPPFQ